MTEDEYHGRPGLSASRLEDLIQSPSLFHGRYITGEIKRREDTDETRLGSAAHLLVLEGQERFDSRIAVWRGGPVKGGKKGEEPRRSMSKNTESYREWSEENKGRIILDQNDIDTVEQMATALHANGQARELLFERPGKTEHTLTWTIPLISGESEIPCKARLDKLCDDGWIVDLKTTGAMTDEAIRKQAVSLGYHRKAEWYKRGYFATHATNSGPFLFVYVRTSPPFDVWVKFFDADAEAIAAIEIDLALDDYRARTISGDWAQARSRQAWPMSIKPYEYSDEVASRLQEGST